MWAACNLYFHKADITAPFSCLGYKLIVLEARLPVCTGTYVHVHSDSAHLAQPSRVANRLIKLRR